MQAFFLPKLISTSKQAGMNTKKYLKMREMRCAMLKLQLKMNLISTLTIPQFTILLKSHPEIATNGVKLMTGVNTHQISKNIVDA